MEPKQHVLFAISQEQPQPHDGTNKNTRWNQQTQFVGLEEATHTGTQDGLTVSEEHSAGSVSKERPAGSVSKEHPPLDGHTVSKERSRWFSQCVYTTLKKVELLG